MPGRRSRSRSPRRRRRSSPDNSRRRSTGDGSRFGRDHSRGERDKRTHDREDRPRRRSPVRFEDKHSDSRGKKPDPPMEDNSKPNKQTTANNTSADRGQENNQVKVTSEVRASRPEGGVAGRRSSLDLPREKNVLFPSGSNTVNRGRDRFRDRNWREERGRMTEGRGRARGRSEGILARESVEENGGRGERRLFEALVDPQEVPRSGNYFEHDDRDGPQATQTRPYSDTRRQDRRFQRSPDRQDRWPRGREVRDRSNRQSHRGRDRLSGSWRRPERDRGRSDRDRGPPRERLGMRSDWSDRRRSGGRDRSPVHWKHDMFDAVNKSPEPEEPVQEEPPADTKWKSKSMEEGIEDFNIDDLLLMENPIEKMELEV